MTDTVTPQVHTNRARNVFHPAIHSAMTTLLWGYVVGLGIYLLFRLMLGDGLWWLAWLNNFAPYYFLPLFIAIPLGVVLRLQRLQVVTIVLLTIGVIWLLPRFVNGSWLNPIANNDSSSQAALKIVTFNVWGGNAQLDRVSAWLRESDADIILLQEVPPAWAGSPIPQLADRYPYKVVQSVDFRPWGDAILSRYPFVVSSRYALEGTFARHERVELMWQGQLIAIYNAHLTLPMSDTPRIDIQINNSFANMLIRYDDTQRNAQIDRLLSTVKAETKPFIVAGDLNVSDNAVTYQALVNSLHDAYRAVGFGFGATWPNAAIVGLPSVMPPLLRIDYVWHSDQFRAITATVGPELGSDHFPVVVTLTLK